MRVISCIYSLHNLWLVALAALVCVGGGWVAFQLFRRAGARTGTQRTGWLFLAAVAAGASVWCTHFIAMLAYEAGAPVTYDPILTMVSLLIAIAGSALAFGHALRPRHRHALEGGTIFGLSVAGMHYSGMAAWHVDGIIEWDWTHVIASVVLSGALGSLSLLSARRPGLLAPLGLFVAAVVSLHFTGMAAVSVTPFATGAPVADSTVMAAMAMAVAGVAVIIVGTGIASYMIDSDVSEQNLHALRHMAMNDALTGLPNRAIFNTYLETELERAKPTAARWR